MSPLNAATSRALIMSGVQVYRKGISGHMHLLTASSLLYVSTHYQAHGCGRSPLGVVGVEVAEHPPASAPAPSELGVFERQGLTCSVVQDAARPHRSELVRCARCDEIMNVDDTKIMVEMPVWQDDNVFKVRGVPGRKGYLKPADPGWGTRRWAVHAHACT